MRKALFLCGVILLLALPAAAQDDYAKNISRMAYVQERFTEGEEVKFYLHGGIFGRYTRMIHKHVGIAGEYGVTWGEPFQLEALNQWTVGGVQLYAVNTERVQLYGQFLGGWDRLRIGQGEGSSDNAGTIVLGGGVNLYFHQNAGVTFEADYKSTWLFDSRQNVLQLRGGLVFRWGNE